MRREYKGAAQPAVLTLPLGGSSANLTITCDDLTNWPTGIAYPFYVVIDRDTPSEEKILCSSRSGNVLTVYNVGGQNGRGADDTSVTAHNVNAVVEHVFTATDADEANSHVNADSGVHGVVGDVVGTSDTQTITNKTIIGNSNNLVVNQSDVTDLVSDLANKIDYATPVNAQTGTSYTFVAADASRLTSASNSSDVTFTIPPQSSVAWESETILRVVNYGAGLLTVNGGAGVTVTNTATTVGQYEAAAAIRTGSNAWTLVPFGGSPGAASDIFQSFTSSGTATAPQKINKVYYLVVGGGNNGANGSGTSGGAGGAGGEVVQGSASIAPGTAITVTVGGAGSNSSIAISGGSTFTATGGGGASAGANGTQPTSPFTLGYFGGGGGNGSNANVFGDVSSGSPGGQGGGGAGGRGANPQMPNYLPGNGFAGKANTGGGGGGGGGGIDDTPPGSGGAGGSGIVVLLFSKES